MTAVDPGDERVVARLLKAALPTARLTTGADGVSVPALHVEGLLGIGGTLELSWSAEARKYAQNRRWAREIHGPLRDEVRRIVLGGRSAAEVLLAGVRGLDVLDAHQWTNVAAMTLPRSFGLCLFDEQGAGKTVTFIFAFEVLSARDMADFALIVAPKSMVSEWPRDFARFRGDLYRVAVAAGSRREKREALRSGPDVVVTNFETALAMEDELRALLRRYGARSVLVVDESFYAKNLNAQRTLALRRIREWAGRTFVLCGTPAPNAPEDLVEQFNLVDFGMTFEGVSLPREREASRSFVRRLIEDRGIYVRHLKQDVLPDLPTKEFERVLLPLQPQQERLYGAALRNLVLDLNRVNDESFARQLTSFLARRMALLQICSNPIGVAAQYTESPAKLLALDELLEDLIRRRGEKVVLWSYYTASINAIMSRFAGFNPLRFDGSVDVPDRRSVVRQFQEQDGASLLVANPAAAGAGLNLQAARFAIYESMSNQAAHYLQSLDRIHRRGQERAVTYLMLLCDGTIEISEYERLMRKEREGHSILGDGVTAPITRTAMINEALELSRLLESRLER